MNYKVIATSLFEKKFKRLAKKYPSLKQDIKPLFDDLIANPLQGTPLGKKCFKIRLGISSKAKGKSGGARVITFIRIANQTAFLVDIYDKSETSAVTEKQLESIIKQLQD